MVSFDFINALAILPDIPSFICLKLPRSLTGSRKINIYGITPLYVPVSVRARGVFHLLGYLLVAAQINSVYTGLHLLAPSFESVYGVTRTTTPL